MKWNKRKILARVLYLSVITALFLLMAWFTAPRLLTVKTEIESADAILVLGGDPLYRPVQAAKIYERGLATNILVTGVGDCKWNQKRLIEYGVPAHLIHIECDSLTTKENSEYCIPWFRQRGMKKVIIVTSWYHSRRSLAVFRQQAPDIQFYAAPSEERLPRRLEIPHVFKEYLKIIYYSVRYGIHSYAL